MAAFPRGWQRWVAIAAVITIMIYSLLLYGQPDWVSRTPLSSAPWGSTSRPPGSTTAGSDSDGKLGSSRPLAQGSHPIDRLIRDARLRHKELLGKRSLTLEQAASRYRERRGRHPPPGFDVWFAAAKERDAIIIEDFFDRIHHDLNPFWGIEPKSLRMQTHTQPQVIRVRNGEAFFETDNDQRPPWIQLWTELVKETQPHLPDLDMVVNVMDETRILVPFEKIAHYVTVEQENRRMIRPEEAIGKYSGVADVEAKKEPFQHEWIDESPRFWEHLRAACPPDSPARNVSALSSFAGPIDYPREPAAYTYKGYVQNFTASQDPCQQPHLRGMHGTFIESVSMATSHKLLPMFAGCKLPQNNEILIPGGMYLTDDAFYSGGNSHGGPWEGKKNGLVWRGVASGGRNKEDNWWHFHRHRWVQMLNGSTVGALERGDSAAAPSFHLPSADTYGLSTQRGGRLGEWVSSFSDVGFVNLECFPTERDDKGGQIKTCPYTTPFMALAPSVPMKAQYDFKFLPDVDGNSYSARWRGFLLSTSVPLKATIYAEWHDDRLVPWVHFVPFDSSYMDIYGVMDYFLRGHDGEAARIAKESHDWAMAVLRRDDMLLYVWRLLLEYARVMDDKRDNLAFVKDLLD